SAIYALGLSMPAKRITINLAPADIGKEGSHFDLPIAIGLLIAMGAIPQEDMDGFVALGELSLDGGLLPVNGVLPAAMHALENNKGIICPKSCGGEAAWSGIGSVLAPSSLLALLNHIKGTQIIPEPECISGNDDIR